MNKNGNDCYDPQVRTLTEDSKDINYHRDNKKYNKDKCYDDLQNRKSGESNNLSGLGDNTEYVLHANIRDDDSNRVVGDKIPEVYFIGQISIGENFFGEGGFCVELLLEVGDYWTLNSPPVCVQTQTCYTKPGMPLIWYDIYS